MKEKRGVTPVVATVLLIAIVIVLAVIIFLWARGFVSERIQKFDRAIDLSCDEVDFEAGVILVNSAYELDIINNGNVPLYGFDVKILGEGEVLVNEIPDNSITIGDSSTVDLSDINIQSGDNLLIVPILLGESDGGKVAHTCADQFGVGVGVL